MDEDQPSAETVAFHVTASGELERRRAYLARGRELEHLPTDNLQAVFIGEIRKWAADPTGQSHRPDFDNV